MYRTRNKIQQQDQPGRAFLNAGYRVIMGTDPRSALICSFTNGEIDPATGLPFLDSKGVFFVKTVLFSDTQFKTMSGYGLWHRRLGHCPMLKISETIPHSGDQRESSLRIRRGTQVSFLCLPCIMMHGWKSTFRNPDHAHEDMHKGHSRL